MQRVGNAALDFVRIMRSLYIFQDSLLYSRMCLHVDSLKLFQEQLAMPGRIWVQCIGVENLEEALARQHQGFRRCCWITFLWFLHFGDFFPFAISKIGRYKHIDDTV